MVVEKRFLIVAAAGMSAAFSLYGHAAFADDDGSSTQAALIQAEAQAEVAFVHSSLNPGVWVTPSAIHRGR
jgi:hypothetical protein